MNIEKIYFINLEDKISRWDVFKNLDSRIRRFSAIDSRSDYRICKKYGLELDPVGLASKLYFSQTTGAVGAYLSHYLIWKDIIKRDIGCALILEDDVKYSDVKKYLQSDRPLMQGHDVCQLNMRYHDSGYFRNFDGLESYLVTRRGADILVQSTHNRSHFEGVVRAVPDRRFGEAKLLEYSMFNRERTQHWTRPNVISCAVDKFVGFCSNPKLLPNKRLSIKFEPKIGLCKETSESDIMTTKFPPWAQSTESQLIELMSSEYYEYWKRGKYVSVNQILS
tara:strand:+ start:25724 stop:26560 length:837 start_codon:yes stop_codon:yes gene_type:complete